jgi:hypothetical protein
VNFVTSSNLSTLCADRLDYFFRDGIMFKMLTKKDVTYFIDHLVVLKNEIMVDNKQVAVEIANKYLEISKKWWTSPEVIAHFQILGDAINIALRKEFIEHKDLFTTDYNVLSKLKKDSLLKHKIKMLNKKNQFVVNPHIYNFYSKGKVRFIDPKIVVGKKVVTVMQTDKKMRERITDYKNWVEKGYHIQIHT